MKKTFNIALVGIIILSFLFVFYPSENCSASGNTLNVPDDYSTIQAAINAASSGDTVFVSSGTYNENIIIDKTLILTGEDRDSTIIVGASESDITLTIKGNFLDYVSNVNISGLQILQNQVAISNEFACMYIEYARGCTITDCTIKDGYNGVRMKQTDESTISENIIENNDGDGILLFIYSDKNEIKNNLIKSNNRGIYLQDFCTENRISANDISRNSNYGIHIIGNSNNNVIYHNNFENSNNANDECSNIWHYSSEGNYWNDYTGSDSDGDGVGDIHYDIPGNINQDLYPLGYFSGSNLQPVATIQSVSPNPATEGQAVVFNGYGTDYDGSIVAWEWKSDDIVINNSENFSTSSLSSGAHTIGFRVQDNYGEWSPESSIVVTILPNLPNNPPFADAGGHYTSYVNQSITFDGSGSYDPDYGDNIISYQWDFGDGSTSEGVSLNHTYVSEGNYTVKLTVTDEYGGQTNGTTYANISMHSNGQNSNAEEDDDGFPGFELIFVIIASAIVLFLIKKKKGS